MKINNRNIGAVLILAIILGFLYRVKEILPIFLWAFIVSYLCLPLCEWLTKHCRSRALAALATTLVIYVIIGGVVSVIPILAIQMEGFIMALPAKILALQEKFLPRISSLVQEHQKLLTSHLSDVSGYIFNILDNILKSGFNIINIAGMTFIMPIVVFYILKDWPVLWHNTLLLIPKPYQPVSQQLTREVSLNLASYLRGQFLVCFLLSGVYGLTLSLMQLDYGFAIGMITGFLSFIPYVGSVLGLLIALIIGFIQYHSWQYLLYISMAFGVIQVLDTYFISTKLIGSKIGIHPIGMMFALLAGGSMLGFSGVLLAIPIASIIIVLMKFIVKQYKQSDLYG